MRWIKRIAFLLAVPGLTATVASSADWVLFIKNQAGDRLYIEKQSMRITPEGKILVWEKIESGSFKIIVQSWLEVDCSRYRYKVLHRKIVSDNEVMSIGPSEEWEGFGPIDYDYARYHAMCGKIEKK